MVTLLHRGKADPIRETDVSSKVAKIHLGRLSSSQHLQADANVNGTVHAAVDVPTVIGC